MSEDITKKSEHWNELFQRIHSLPEPPKIMHELVAFLKEKGHTCACIENNKLSWCEQDKCRDLEWQEEISQAEEKNNQLMAKLRSEGHQCMEILEGIPPQIRWCHRRPCSSVTTTNNAHVNSNTN